MHGQAVPSLQKLVALAELFKVSLDYLIFQQDAEGNFASGREHGQFAQYLNGGYAFRRRIHVIRNSFNDLGKSLQMRLV